MNALYPLLCLGTADTPTAKQAALMRMFYRHIDFDSRLEISNGHLYGDICSGWIGLKCTNRILTKIQYIDARYGNFAIEYAPPSVERLTLVNSSQLDSPLKTRYLPREARYINLSCNNITGEVDLATLPAHLETLSLSFNLISGGVHLIDMPKSLKTLNLDGNIIRQDTVLVHKIPPAAERLSMIGPLTIIQKVRCIDPAELERAKQVCITSHALIS